MENYIFYNDIDITDSPISSSDQSLDADDAVLRKLAGLFYWENGTPDFSLSYNRELLNKRMAEYGTICMNYEGPQRFTGGRYADHDSIEVSFRSMKERQSLGPYPGTPRVPLVSGNILSLKNRHMQDN